MGWKTRGLRGSTLEEMVNMTIESYRARGLAIVQKIPTPITPLKLDNETRTISLAYFEQKSTVDYIGAVQGIPICFDAKESSHKRLPLQNIHEHQVEFMRDFERQGGIAFLLVYFSFSDEHFYLPFSILEKYWLDSQGEGRKSIPYSAFEQELRVYNKNGFYMHFLEPLSIILEREKK